MESYTEKVLNAIPVPKNHTEMLIKMNHLSRLPSEFKSRNDIMCSKCLTPWTLGKFSQKILPSNHHRKKRRQFQIERLQKQINSGESSKPDVVRMKRKWKRLQQQNNHVALYKCFCNSITKVHLRKATIPTTTTTTAELDSTIEKEKKKDEQAAAVTNKLSMKEKKKKRKTAGLLIPISHKPSPSSSSSATTSSSKNIKLSKLSNILQKQKNSETIRQSKLNQFLK